VDYNLSKSARLFYRYNYFGSFTDATFFAASFMVYANKNNSRSHVVGWTSTREASITASL